MQDVGRVDTYDKGGMPEHLPMTCSSNVGATYITNFFTKNGRGVHLIQYWERPDFIGATRTIDRGLDRKKFIFPSPASASFAIGGSSEVPSQVALYFHNVLLRPYMNGFTHDGADPGAFEGQLVMPPSHEGQPTLDRFPQRPLHDDTRRVWHRRAP